IQEANNLTNQKNDLQNQVNDLNQQLTLADNAINTLHQELNQRDGEIRRLENKIRELEEKLNLQTSNLTPEQKEKNKQYVLEHLDEYTLDSHGNFVLFSPDIDPEDEEIHFYFGKDKINDWEIIFEKTSWGFIKGIEGFRHKPSKKRIYENVLFYDMYYYM
ncbi:13932_t:CDS:2, partial [Racocetra persica]